MNKKLDKKTIAALLFIIVVLLIPIAVSNSYTLRILCNVMIYSIIALSINLIVGYCGQLDFGRAAFVGLAVVGNIVAAWAWFGVNLMGVGQGVL